MIKKCDLLDGEYYAGECRNTTIARWDSSRGVFVYLRYKFGTSYAESINHPEDDDGADLFTPEHICNPAIYQEVSEYDLRKA